MTSARRESSRRHPQGGEDGRRTSTRGGGASRLSVVASTVIHGGQRQEAKGKAASVNNISGDVVLINNLRSRIGQVVPRIIRQHPLVVILSGLALYVAVLLVFACVYYAIGEGCFYNTSGRFDFLEMTWLSVHTISTIGYGSVHPTCASSQLVVSVEAYVSVLVQAVVSAYVVFIFMRSRTRIRFSKNCLVTRDTHAYVPDIENGNDGAPIDVNFRLMRQSLTAVRDARIYVQARFTYAKVRGDAQDGGKVCTHQLNAQACE
jgi:hypothetical protein